MEKELRRRQEISNRERDPTRATGLDKNGLPRRRPENRVEIDRGEYELLMRIAAGAKKVLPILEERGLPVMQPSTWELIHGGLAELDDRYRWAGDTGMENQIADLLALAEELADGR